MTIEDIIEKAGGRKAIAEAITEARGKEMKPDAVRKWPQTGIPDRHWPVIMELARDVTPQALFDANVHARANEMAEAS